MKKGFFALLACVLLVSCAKLPETEQGTYTLTVEADKAAGSKALAIEGGALKAAWKAGETVTVYKAGTLSVLGTLTAQSDGQSTTLSGTISGSFSVGSDLRLEFLTPDNYESQDGTLTGKNTSIDKTCDYATADVKVTGIEGGTITTENATFANRQAIVKFSLKPGGAVFSMDQMTIKVTGQTKSITISVVPEETAYELYVAIPCFYDTLFSFDIDVLSVFAHYYKTIASQTLENGKYYHYALTF